MDIETLRERAAAHLALHYPALQDGATRLVDECLTSARRSLRDEFICRLSPEAWASIALTYIKHFVDTGADVSVGEMFAAAIRDSINLNRLDVLTQDLAQRKTAPPGEAARPAARPTLTIVKDG